jgi:hypothetical protein
VVEVNYNFTWRQALAWVVLWVSLVTAIVVVLPFEQSWWVGTITIVASGVFSAVVVQSMAERR